MLERYRNLIKDAENNSEIVADEDAITKTKRRRIGMVAASTATDIPKLVTIGEALAALDHDETGSTSINNTSRVQSQQLMRTASRIALHMMREDASQDSQIPSTQLQQDFFVLNACKVFVKFESPMAMEKGWLFVSSERRQEIIDSIPATIPFNAQNTAPSFELYDKNGFGEDVKKKALDILEVISSKREMGIIVSDLPAAVGRLENERCTLQRHIELLAQSQLIVRVGLVAARYVAMQHTLPWVVQSFKLLRNGKEKLEPFNRPKQLKLDETVAQQENAEAVESIEPVGEATVKVPEVVHAPVAEGTRRKRKINSVSNTQQIAKTIDSLGEE